MEMKISSDFQVSPNFTHLHQIKSVGGDFASIPMFTLTARKATPDRLELRYTSTNDQNTIKTADLDLLRGNWVSITVDLTYGTNSNYEIEIKNTATDAVILYYQNSNLDNWQAGAEFARPKWGIYRSLNNAQDLKDEAVLFADFSIEETSPLSIDKVNLVNNAINIYPNPSENFITIENSNISFDGFTIYSVLGKTILEKQNYTSNKIDISSIPKGNYFIMFKKEGKVVSRNNVLVH